MPLSILDGSITQVEAAIPKLSLGELESLLEAERKGKTRKGAIAALEAAIAAAEPAEEPAEPAAEVPAVEPEAAEAGPRRAEGEPPLGFETVENNVPHSDITLHDGSHLLFGESAHVPELLAWEMRGRRQVA